MSPVFEFTAEKAKGRVVTLAGGGTYFCRYRCGALGATAAKTMVHQIEAVGIEAVGRETGSAS